MLEIWLYDGLRTRPVERNSTTPKLRRLGQHPPNTVVTTRHANRLLRNQRGPVAPFCFGDLLPALSEQERFGEIQDVCVFGHIRLFSVQKPGHVVAAL